MSGNCEGERSGQGSEKSFAIATEIVGRSSDEAER